MAINTSVLRNDCDEQWVDLRSRDPGVSLMAEPILKWAGGKRQLLEQIRGEFPTHEIGDYHEPFFGGGAVFFREMSEKAATINDINRRLMNFYRVVKESPEELLNELDQFDNPTSEPDPSLPYTEEDEHGRKIKNYYYQQRARFNRRPNGKGIDRVTEAALLLYLNRTCYNGLYRENNSGEFNVPCGQHRSPNWKQEPRIRNAHELLQNVDILNEDFSYVTDESEPEDLVYFDPPYDPNSESSTFSEYSCGSFGREEQIRLRQIAEELDNNDVYVVISNAPSIADAYRFDEVGRDVFNIVEVGARRAINSDGTGRGEVGEILISNVEDVRARDTTLADYS